MAIINDETLEALRNSVSTKFDDVLKNTPAIYGSDHDIQGSGPATVMGFLEGIPQMREWVGPKQAKDLKEHAVTVVPALYELTIGLQRTDLEDDNMGMFEKAISNLPSAAVRNRDQKMAEATLAGLTENGYDGTTFYSTTHALSGTNQSNSKNLALDATNLAAVISALKGFKDESGNVIYTGAEKPILEVPTALEWTAKQLVGATLLSNNTNVLQGAAEVRVNPYLNSDPTRWFVHANPAGVKPVMWLEREAPRLTDDVNSGSAFRTNTYNFSVEARGKAFLSLWFLSVTSKP